MVIRGRGVSVVLNEAELRGIDMKQLRKELFTSREHLAMVAKHEEVVRNFYRRKHFPVKQSGITVYADSMLDTVDNKFTERQIEIAIAVLEKDKLK